MKPTKDVQKRIVTFLLIALALSAIFYYLIISAGTLKAGHGLYVLGLMWCPGITALTTQLVFHRNLRGLGWGWGKTKYQMWSYAIPFLYGLAAYAIAWATGLGGFYNEEFVRRFAMRLAPLLGPNPSPTLVIPILVIASATLGVLFSCISALGEEIG